MLTPGTTLQNRYRIIRQIGGGGQAIVWLAEDLNLGGQRALKELLPDLAATPQEHQQALDQFQREAHILAGLSHPNLPRVWDHFRVSDTACLVMDHIKGETLEQVMQRTPGFLPEAAVLRWAKQLCDVLDYLHRQNPPVVFRDLKPANVMLDRTDTIKLIDFGIARLFKAGKASDTLRMGTPGYAPLEQYTRHGQTDPRSDIYALGATLYHLLTKHEPEDAIARTLPGRPDPLQPTRVWNPTISTKTEAILMKAMAMKPEQRWQTSAEMRNELFAPVRVAAPSVVRPTGITGIGLAGLSVIALLVVFLLWPRDGTWRLGNSLTPLLAPSATTTSISVASMTVTTRLTRASTITPRYTSTVTRTPTWTPVRPSPTPSPTIPVRITVGGHVEVVYMLPDGVWVRKSPGYKGKDDSLDIIATLFPPQRLQVVDGPRAKDDLIWWKLKGQFGEGWVAEYSSKGSRLIAPSGPPP